MPVALAARILQVERDRLLLLLRVLWAVVPAMSGLSGCPCAHGIVSIRVGSNTNGFDFIQLLVIYKVIRGVGGCASGLKK